MSGRYRLSAGAEADLGSKTPGRNCQRRASVDLLNERRGESARPPCPDLREYCLRNAEAGLLKFRDGIIEVDKPGLFSIIENGKCAGNPQTSANCFLPPSLVIDENNISMHFLRERDRLAFAGIEGPRHYAGLGAQDIHPRGRVSGPVLHRFWRKRMLEFREHSGRNKNPFIELFEDADLCNQDKVVDR